MRQRCTLISVLAVGLVWLGCGCEGGKRPAVAADRDRAALPQRIVSQTVLSDEILWALGEPVRARVVAVSAMADDERYSRVAGRWPATLPRVRASSEQLLAMAPDLAIVADFTAAEARALLHDSGVRTLSMSGFGGFDDYRRHVRELAASVGAEDAGELVVQRFERRLAEIRVDVPGGERPGIVSWIDGSVPGAGTTFDDAARAAGYENLAAAHERSGHVRLSVEQVVAWDPEYVVTSCGAIPCDEAERALAEREGFAATRAALDGHIVAVPSRYLLAVGEGMLEVVEILAARRPPGETQ